MRGGPQETQNTTRDHEVETETYGLGKRVNNAVCFGHLYNGQTTGHHGCPQQRLSDRKLRLPPWGLGGDASCSTADLDAISEVFGTNVPPTDAVFDLNSDNVVGAADLNEWLSLAATENGHGSPYLRGDTDRGSRCRHG